MTSSGNRYPTNADFWITGIEPKRRAVIPAPSPSSRPYWNATGRWSGEHYHLDCGPAGGRL